MRKSFLIVNLVASLMIALVGCGPRTVKLPDRKSYDFKHNLNSLKTCSKPESGQIFTAESRQNSIFIEDEIESKDIETIDCEGKVTKRSFGPAKELHKFITIEPPSGLNSAVSFVEVTNSRTCSASRITANGTEIKEEFKLPNGDTVKLDSILSTATTNGAIRLALTDSDFNLSVETNVVEGLNVISIKYFGKCLQYRPVKDDKLGDSYNCINGELLATKDMIVEVKIHRPKGEGVLQRSICIR